MLASGIHIATVSKFDIQSKKKNRIQKQLWRLHSNQEVGPSHPSIVSDPGHLKLFAAYCKYAVYHTLHFHLKIHKGCTSAVITEEECMMETCDAKNISGGNHPI